MQLTFESADPEKDIEAIARSRVNRSEGNKQTLYFLGMIAGIVAGFMLRNTSIWLSGGISLLAIFGFYYYNNGLTKRQRAYTKQMLIEVKREAK